MSKHLSTIKNFVPRYLGRPWSPRDGLSEKVIAAAERRLGLRLPSALRDFYLAVGRVKDICSIHNQVFSPADLTLEENYLLFMDENQSVVTWGIRKGDLRLSNPPTWQRNNTSDEWYPEDKNFLQLMKSMFDWYLENGMWESSKRKHRPDPPT